MQRFRRSNDLLACSANGSFARRSCWAVQQSNVIPTEFPPNLGRSCWVWLNWIALQDCLLICSCPCHAGQDDASLAIYYLEQMVADGLVPSMITYNALMDAVLGGADAPVTPVERALSLIKTIMVANPFICRRLSTPTQNLPQGMCTVQGVISRMTYYPDLLSGFALEHWAR